MPRVIHFEMHAEDPQRCIGFYRALFGWEFRKWDGPMDYWHVTTGPGEERGINGGLIRRQGEIDGQAVIAYVCTVDVDSVDATAAQARAQGGMVAVPKMPIPEVGWLAYCKDTEGNLFGILESDPEAR